MTGFVQHEVELFRNEAGIMNINIQETTKMSKVWEHTLDEYEKSIKSSDVKGAAILRALLLPQLERPSAMVDSVYKMATVEPTYTVLENNPGEWIIVKASDSSFLWSEKGWVRARDGVYIMNFPSEFAALTFAQQQAALHLPASDIPAPWKDWPTEHLLRKIAMPEGFVTELRKRTQPTREMFKFGGLIDAFDLVPNDVAEQIETLGKHINELRKWVEDHFDPDCAFCGKNLTECECPQPL